MSDGTVPGSGPRVRAGTAGRGSSAARDRPGPVREGNGRPPAAAVRRRTPKHRESAPPASEDRLEPPPFGVLVRWIELALLVVAVAVGAGYALSAVQDPVYGAETDVLYRATDSGARAERDLATQQVILQGRTVLEPLAEDAGIPVAELQDLVSVEVVGQSDILRITVAHTDPSRAVELAGDVADRYVDTVTTGRPTVPEGEAFVERSREEFAEELDAIEGQLAALEVEREQLAGAEGTDPAEEERIQAEEDRLQAEAEQLQAQVEGLETLLAGSAIAPGGVDVRVLTGAYLLEEPLAPQPLRAAVVGGVGGLVVVGALGAVLARGWGYM